MFRHQVIFVVSFSMLLAFAYGDPTPMYSGQRNFDTMKTVTNFRKMMSTIVQTFMKNTMGNYTGPLNVVGVVHERIALSKKYEKEMHKKYEEMLKKKESFEELKKSVNQMSSVGSNEEIQQKLIEVQATASKGFEKLSEIENMKADVKRAIPEAEISGNELIACVNKSFLFLDSLLLGNEHEIRNALFSMPSVTADVLSKISSDITNSDRLSAMLKKLEERSTEAKKNINDALKGLQEVEAAQKDMSVMKQPLALGVKDTHGTIMKDFTSVPSLIYNFACFAGVMMFTIMGANYL